MVDIIDYTLLQKKGLMKKSEHKKMPYKITNDGMVDMTSAVNDAIAAETQTSSTSTGSGSGMASNPFGFLDSVSQSSGTEQQTSNAESDKEINALKIKLDDLEYKLQRLIERLEQLEGKG